MPVLDDTSRDFSVASATDKGISILVRRLGLAHWCGRHTFRTRIISLSASSFDIQIHFWVRNESTSVLEFKRSSSPITITSVTDTVISFTDYVLSPYDYFFVSIEVVDFGILTDADFRLQGCYLSSPNSPLIMQRNGLLLDNESMFNVGYVDRIFQDSVLRRNVYGETLTVASSSPHIADLDYASDQDKDHTVVYENGTPMLGTEYNFNSATQIQITDPAYTPGATYTIDYYTAEAFTRFSQAKIDGATENISIHSPVQRRQGYFCNNILDGDNRYYDSNDDVLEIMNVDAWGVSATDIMDVDVDITLGPDEITCTFASFTPQTVSYVKGQTLTFNFGTASDGGLVKVYCGITAAVVSLSAKYVKKYFTGIIDTNKNLEFVDSDNYPYWKPAADSIESEDLTFSYVGPDWEAPLTYKSTQDKTKCLLLRDGEPIPDTYWDFVDEETITLDNAEYDSSAVYNFEYETLIEAEFIIDISTLSSIDDLYLLPYTDIFVAGLVVQRETDKEETVRFDTLGRGRLQFISNNVIGDVSILRTTPDGETEIPVSAIQRLADDEIVINPVYYRQDAYFSVSYKAIITDIEKFAEHSLEWSYWTGSAWTTYIDWNGDYVPARYYDTGSVLFTDEIKLRITLSNVESKDKVQLRGLGIFLLNPYSWDILAGS